MMWLFSDYLFNTRLVKIWEIKPNLEASDAADEEDIVECPRPKEEMVELPGRIEGPMTEEQVNVEPPKDDCANSSSEKAPLVAAAGFLIIEFKLG